MKNCPTCGAKKMAEGGDTMPEAQDDTDQETMPEGAEPLDDASPAAANDAPEEMPEEAAAPAADPAEKAAPAAAAPAADDNTIEVIGNRPPETPQEMAARMNQHDAQFQQDLARGTIHPKTVQDLFASKDTLGKIGTLFGLLVSGAGAGLTHQSNAVMDLMNKQIQNDLEAQKASNENSQNWLRLSQAHALQEAQIPLMQAQTGQAQAATAQTKAQTGMIPAQTAQLGAHIKNLDADTQYKSTMSALNRMKIAAVQHLSDEVSKMPPGPVKDQAVSQLDTLTKGVTMDIAQANGNTANVLKARGALRGENPPDSGIDDKKLLAKQQLGAQAAEMGITDPNGIMPGDMPTVSTQAGQVKLNRSTYNAYVNSFTKLNNAFAAGKLNPELRKAEIGNFESALAKQIGGGEARSAVDSMFPDVKDWGPSRAEKFDKTTEHFKVQESGTDALDKYGLKSPFPKVPNPAAPPARKAGASAAAAPAPVVKKMGGASYEKVGKVWRKVQP